MMGDIHYIKQWFSRHLLSYGLNYSKGIKMHPYKSQARDNNPKWMKGVEKYVEKKASDLSATVRNHGGDPKATAQAAYEPQRKGK